MYICRSVYTVKAINQFVVISVTTTGTLGIFQVYMFKQKCTIEYFMNCCYDEMFVKMYALTYFVAVTTDLRDPRVCNNKLSILIF